jgi:hypothetical protein
MFIVIKMFLLVTKIFFQVMMMNLSLMNFVKNAMNKGLTKQVKVRDELREIREIVCSRKKE